jgi:hypothetical protein
MKKRAILGALMGWAFIDFTPAQATDKNPKAARAMEKQTAPLQPNQPAPPADPLVNPLKQEQL